MWATPSSRPVGVSSGGRQTNTAPARAGVSSGSRTAARASATVASGRQDHRLGGHQSAGRVFGVAEQSPHRTGFVGVHQPEELLCPLRRQLGDEVGRVVGRHLLQDVGGPFGADLLQDPHLLCLRQLFEHVCQPLVVEGTDELDLPLGIQLEDHAGEVGRAEFLEGLHQVGDRLDVGLDRQARNSVEVDDRGGTAPAESLSLLEELPAW